MDKELFKELSLEQLKSLKNLIKAEIERRTIKKVTRE